MVNTRATNAQSHPGLAGQTNVRAPRRTSAEVAAEKQAKEDRKQAKLDAAARKADRLNDVTAEAKAEDQAYATPVPPKAVVKRKAQPLKRTASVADLAQFEADIHEASFMLPPPLANRQGKKSNTSAHAPTNTAGNTRKAAPAQAASRPTPVPIKSKSSGTPIEGTESGAPAEQSQAMAANSARTAASTKSVAASANPVTMAHAITDVVDSKRSKPKPQKQSASGARTQEDKTLVMVPPGITHPRNSGSAPKPARILPAKPLVVEDDSVTESDSPPPGLIVTNDESVTESDSQAPVYRSPADSDFSPSRAELQPPKKKVKTQLEPPAQLGSKGKNKAATKEVSGKKRVGDGKGRKESDEVEIVAESKKKQTAVKVNKLPPAKAIHQKIFLDKMRDGSEESNRRYVLLAFSGLETSN